MSNKTPSGRRKAGREAFNPCADPVDLQPYIENSYVYEMNFPDWLEGWREAEEEYHKKKRNTVEITVSQAFLSWWNTLPCSNDKGLMYIAWSAWQAGKKTTKES